MTLWPRSTTNNSGNNVPPPTSSSVTTLNNVKSSASAEQFQRRRLYRSADPISALQLVVTVRQTGSRARPLRSQLPAADDSNENLDPNADREGGLEPDASPVALRTVRRTVRWQEKLFGHRELLHYAGRTPQFAQKQMAPNPELEHDFHLQVERMLLADVRKETAESRVVNNTVVRAVGEDDHELLIFTRIDAEAFREDKAVDDRVEFPSTDAHMVKKHVTRDDATKEDGSLERMHVMVSIKTGENEFLEWRLCTIEHNSDTDALTMMPPLTKKRQPLHFMINDHDAFEVDIESAFAETADVVTGSKEQRIQSEIAKRRPALDAKAFVTPPSIDTVFFFGEIMSVSGVEGAESIYVQYLLDLPRGWRSADHTAPIFTGTTQKAVNATGRESGEPLATFGYPLELDLLHERSGSAEDDDEAEWERRLAASPSKRHPLLYFQLKSYSADYNRHTTIGYGYCTLPISTGSLSEEVQLWRPVVDEYAEMRSYFLGTGIELENLSFLDQTKKSRILNKFGGRVTSVGMLTVRFHRAEIRHDRRGGSGANAAFGTGVTTNPYLSDVREALERAKARVRAMKADTPVTPALG